MRRRRRLRKDSLVRLLALAKLRELRRLGLSYREIGRRYGRLHGAECPESGRCTLRLPPERLLEAHGPVSEFGGQVEESGAVLRRAVDVIDPELAFFDCDGALLHANRPLVRTLDAHAEGERLRREMEHFAETVSALIRWREIEQDTAMSEELDVRKVPTREEELRLRGSYIDLDLFGVRGTIVVEIEWPAPDPLSETALRRRFGLTRQETRVARLLAAGQPNAEIAKRLSISPHTARHHTEHVLRKVGVDSRAEVAAKVLRHGGDRLPRPTSRRSQSEN